MKIAMRFVQAVIVLFLVTRPAVADEAGVPSLIEKSDLALVGALNSVQSGTFWHPARRSGELKVLKALKGAPAADPLEVRLADNWGPPCRAARMGMAPFLVIAGVSVLVPILVFYIWWRYRLREAIGGTAALAVVWWFTFKFYCAVSAPGTAPGASKLPADWVGVPAVWVIQKTDDGQFATPYPLSDYGSQLCRTGHGRKQFTSLSPDPPKALSLLTNQTPTPRNSRRTAFPLPAPDHSAAAVRVRP
jgi:hypothetical protein